MQYDSALGSYEATASQRLSFYIGVRAVGRDRLAYRHEDAARIHWSRKSGPSIELLGSRSFVGAYRGNFGDATDKDLADFISLPYFPGRDRLWTGDGLITDFVGQAGVVQDSVNVRQLVHPLARGAEEFYAYAIGDSLQIGLPGSHTIMLRELRITARRPRWNLIVGSFWFDVATADLVRATYRLSAPTDIGTVTRERGDPSSPPRWLAALVGPMRYNITAITVEYALVNERYWLPRLQTVDGTAMAGPMTAKLRIEQRFEYANALGTAGPSQGDSLTAGAAGAAGARGATGVPSAMSAMNAVSANARERERERERECASTGSHTVVTKRFAGAVVVTTSVPCDRVKLAHAAELPASMFDDDTERFDSAARQEMLDALSMRVQSAWSPQAPVIEFGLPQSRFNRIEGFSTGAVLHSQLGRGYETSAMLRASLADRQINGELALSRSNGRTKLSSAAYRRLEASNDWGAPLSMGASLATLFAGRDEGAYFRTTGAELTANAQRSGALTWRAFAERQRGAKVETYWSLFGDSAGVLSNPTAQLATQYGVSVRWRRQAGDDPEHVRLSSDVRTEVAAGDFAYARVLAEATATRNLGSRLVGAVTTAVGATAGDVPTQRQFFLGGTQSIRGQRGLAASGNALWMARGEVGMQLGVIRPTLFGDIGWAGARERWQTPGRPLSGVGTGVSVFDGLVRFDIARGLSPRRQWRIDLSLDSRF